MTLTTPSAGDQYRVPSAPPAYAGPPPSLGAAPWPAGPGAHGLPGGPVPARARPSWVAWAALGLSALSFFIATSIGIIYAADRLGASESSEEYFYDAGQPSWGTVDLAPSGAATELALNNGVAQALQDSFEEGVPIEEVYCEPLPAPKRDTVTSCSVLVDEIDSTVVLLFLNDKGAFLATLY